jgi:hypothetical protein
MAIDSDRKRFEVVVAAGVAVDRAPIDAEAGLRRRPGGRLRAATVDGQYVVPSSPVPIPNGAAEMSSVVPFAVPAAPETSVQGVKLSARCFRREVLRICRPFL